MRMEREPGKVLADLYRQYWSLPEETPLETFEGLHKQIDITEAQVGVDTAWHTLEASARAWYEQKGTCPFCGKDELHLDGR